MRNLSKFVFILFLLFLFTSGYLFYKVNNISAQTPGLLFPCDETSDNEFHSLRPYQASPCGPYPKQALFCSNKLVIFENFKLEGEEACLRQRRKQTGSFDCSLSYNVEEHDLNITLDESELPIMGNTQDDFDDAQKVNEYASWYLSGLNSVGSEGEADDNKTINFSGPVNKLLPQIIQQAERINSIKGSTEKQKITIQDESEEETTADAVDRHDQIVVCGDEFRFLGITIGQTKPTDCYSGNEKIRISEWSDEFDLSDFNAFFNTNFRTNTWNKRYPPLPWADENGKPFETQQAYQKAYREWSGESCANIPGIDLTLCADNPFVPNKWATLYSYIPLVNNDDSEGKNYLLTGDGPSYVPSSGTEIEDAQHKDFKNALLYFSHMQEVLGLSGLLNKTYSPQGYESEKLPETTEKIKKGIHDLPLPNTLSPDKQYSADPYNNLDCSAVNVRVNEGDDLFPGDRPSEKELFVEAVKYTITQVKCDEVYERPTKFGCGEYGADPCPEVWTLNCPAQVGIEFKTGTRTPHIDDIFSQTVADSGSTFRKIFPKVEEGAPVECIADIPTTTNVTYSIENDLHESPAGGVQEFKQTVYPADGANSGTQLTFPHVGSVYEYFLKGIQTALRPKGYGEPIANGNCKPTELEEEVKCDEDVPDSAVNEKYLGSFKDNFIDLANRWSEKCPGEENNMAKQCYNFVASEAQKAGVNPAFALTIWLNESGASNYCEGGPTTQDMGMNVPAIYQDLAAQVDRFMDFAKVKWCDGMSGYVEPMHGWLSRFQSSAGICNPSDAIATQYYYDVMNFTWNAVSGCNNGKFGITWPTDMSCP